MRLLFIFLSFSLFAYEKKKPELYGEVKQNIEKNI